MLGKRCSLCGGKLNHENVCIECGLDNGKSDKNYKVNQSSCDKKPLTHVHEEAAGKKKGAGKQKKEKKTKKGKRKIAAIAVVTSVIFSLISAAGDMFGDIFGDVFYQIENLFISESGSDYEETETADPYEYVETELPEEGEEMEYMLEPGEYVVGVHIPAGNYTAKTEDEFDAVRVDDYENQIYLYEYDGKGENSYMDDLRLYRGAHVMIDAENPVKLSTENAQLSDMYGIENPLTEEVRLNKTSIAGEDFKEGIYDLERLKGTGFVKLIIYEDSGESYELRYLHFAEDSRDGYKYLVLPKNAELAFEDDEDLELKLTPSAQIENTEYSDYYLYK